MNSIIVFSETFTNGYRAEILDFISLASILCGILVIISKNPIVSVLFLIGLFTSISCYLMLLGLNFIGLSYILVYVGAVSILFLFILMLINVRLSELLSDTSNSIPLAIMVIISIIYSVYQILPSKLFSSSDIGQKNSVISYVTSQRWDGNLAETTHITSIGNIMYTSYSIWLILTSIILLLAMVGAIVITIKSESNTSYNPPHH